MTLIRNGAHLGGLVCAVLALSSAPGAAQMVFGPERVWLAQEGATTEGNGGALQEQKILEEQLRRIGVDYPAGSFMTLDQVDRLNSLFNLKEDEATTRDQARQILGM
jgi:hypothetical protein